MIDIRAATLSDIAALASIDTWSVANPQRTKQIARWVEDRGCFLASINGVSVGYGVVLHHFFDQPMLELVMVADASRRKGIGESLVRHAIRTCNSPQLWTSTNVSNLPMQRLLDRLGFIPSGQIEGLDEGDPELIYRIATGRPRPPAALDANG